MSGLAKLAGRLAAFTPLAALLVGVNVFVDPAHLFDRGRTVDRIAEAAAHGQSVTGLANFDERALQRAYVRRLPAAPTILVLGSSRVMGLGAAELGRPDVRNAGVSGAALLDVLGIYELYRRAGRIPREVVLGVDPWMFNANSGDTRWVSLASEASAMLGRLQLPAPNRRVIVRAQTSRLATLVSLDYFQAGIRELLADRGGRASFILARSDSNPGLTRRVDGSIVYGEDIRHATATEVARAAQAYAEASPMYQLGGFTHIDPADSVKFVRLLDAMRRDGVAVTLLLAPYHPTVHRVLAHDPRYAEVANVEAMVHRLGASIGVAVCGSYDPAASGFAEADFYDGMHARPDVLGRVLARCRSQARSPQMNAGP